MKAKTVSRQDEWLALLPQKRDTLSPEPEHKSPDPISRAKRDSLPPGQYPGTCIHSDMAAIQKCGFKLAEPTPPTLHTRKPTPSSFYGPQMMMLHNAVDYFHMVKRGIFYTEGIHLLYNH